VQTTSRGNPSGKYEAIVKCTHVVTPMQEKTPKRNPHVKAALGVFPRKTRKSGARVSHAAPLRPWGGKARV